MYFMREVIRQNKNGTVLKYYEEVESYRIKGKIKQRHILVMDSLRLNNWKITDSKGDRNVWNTYCSSFQHGE